MHIHGGVAQLGERTVRIRKVESSILFVSTRKSALRMQCAFYVIHPCGIVSQSFLMDFISHCEAIAHLYS